MNEYFIPGFLIDTTDSRGGSWVAAWQHVKDGAQVAFVDVNSAEMAAPAAHEFHPTSSDPHFAPGVLTDPSISYTPPTIAEYVAAVKAGTVDQLVQKAQAAAAAAASVAQLAQPPVDVLPVAPGRPAGG